MAGAMWQFIGYIISLYDTSSSPFVNIHLKNGLNFYSLEIEGPNVPIENIRQKLQLFENYNCNYLKNRY